MGKTQNPCRGGHAPPQFPLDELPGAMKLLARAISQQSAREAKKTGRAEDTELPPQLLTAREVGAILNVTPDHVHRLARRGDLSSLHFGRKVRFKVSDIKKWLEQCEKEGASW